MNTLYIIQHEEITPPGTLLDWANEGGIIFKIIRLDKGDTFPLEVTSKDGVIILGGTMDTYEVEKHPWIIEEKKFIIELLDKNIPLLGICLGAQLLGECVGAKVSENSVWEIGWMPVFFNEESKIEESSLNEMKLQTVELSVAHFHRFRVETNSNIFVTATSNFCDVQAFYVKGKKALGIQFHPEADSKWFGDFKYPSTADVNEVHVQSKITIAKNGLKFESKAREYFFKLLSKHFLSLCD